ncbi:kelch-like protein 41b [Drosophila novamexicana]|uniref:kelch-like protein 41b n=1 Tax=Drosophila novamexicana TaxID=47314 RepID=UPI0011E5A3DA|nr:kelch-like protein 41b [Drosophila novamexicana]
MQNTATNWQDLRPRERMEHLLMTGHLSDCSFVVFDNDGNKILLKCHKFVLMSVSPVFERMFEGDFEEAKIPDNIVLNDVSGNDFRKFIEYLYWHDNRRLDSYDLQTLQTLIYLSKKFMVSFFTNNCLNVIKRRLASGLEADVTIDLYEYGHQIEDEELIANIRLKFRVNAEAYINAAAVFDLSSEIFLKFIEDFDGIVGDKLRFSVIDRYCNIHGLVESSAKPSPDNTFIESDNDDEVSDYSQMTKKIKPVTEARPQKDIHKEVEIEQAKEPKDENENDVEKEKDVAVDQVATEQSEQEMNSEKEQEKRDEYIRNLLKTIKFTSMTAYDFCAGPGTSNLLTIEKKYEVLSSICIAEHKMRLLTSYK